MSWFVLQWGLTTKDPYIEVQKKEKTTRKTPRTKIGNLIKSTI